MAHNFEFYAPTKIIFGKGAEKQAGQQAKLFGASRVLIVYGGGSVVRSELLDKAKSALREENITFSELRRCPESAPGQGI